MEDCDVTGATLSGGDVAARSGPTVRRRRLGLELRRLREAAGLTAAEAAKAIRGSEAKISRMENGLVSFRAIDVGDLLHAYGIADETRREAILALAKETRQQGWWHAYGDVVPRWFEVYVGLEAEASYIATFETLLVPGLLQTADYARAVMRVATPQVSDAEIDRAVELRLGRQSVLTADPPPQLWVILDEAVIRRAVGGREVMRAQLAHLTDMSGRPGITIQVLPFRLGAHAGMGGSFILLGFPDGDNAPEIVYIDQATGSLYLDRPGDVSQYRERMDSLRVSAYDETASRRVIADAMEGIEGAFDDYAR